MTILNNKLTGNTVKDFITAKSNMKKKRYAIIGVSGRGRGYMLQLLTTFAETSEIVAMLDSNPARIEDFNETNNTSIPGYREDEFDKLVNETHPDVALVSTTDNTHHIYIIAALKHNMDVITEKPMTTKAEYARAILEAEKASKGKVTVTFNYRYAPVHTKLKEMILDNKIGKPTLVDFNYYLDTFHGASYFKRWNRYEEFGGSLLVTKACHHFDLVNWWLGQEPVEVFAYGKLNYYGPDGPENPEKVDGRRCATCKTKCMYYKRHYTGNPSYDEHLINFNNPGKTEKFGKIDGYYPDRCIFDSDIDTWDTFSLVVRYSDGAMMSYSLNASVPYEGYHLAINGTGGRLETEVIHGLAERLPFPKPEKPQNIRYIPLFEALQVHEVINKGGGHGGGDPLINHELFVGPDPNDRTKRAAGAWEGALSVLVGVAARESLKSGKPIKIADLLKG